MYNPNGVFGVTSILSSYFNFQHSLCVYEDCAWAGSNNLPVQGYQTVSDIDLLPNYAEPCTPTQTGCVATDRGQDYPDPGRGLADGLKLGFGTNNLDLAACPGVLLQPDGSLDGLPTCGACLVWWETLDWWWTPQQQAYYSHCGTPPQDTTNSPGSLSCFTWCPHPEETRTPTVVRAVFRALLMCGLLFLAAYLSEQLVAKPRGWHVFFIWVVFGLELLGLTWTHT